MITQVSLNNFGTALALGTPKPTRYTYWYCLLCWVEDTVSDSENFWILPYNNIIMDKEVENKWKIAALKKYMAELSRSVQSQDAIRWNEDAYNACEIRLKELS